MGWLKSLFISDNSNKSRSVPEDEDKVSLRSQRALHNEDIKRILYTDYKIDIGSSQKLHIIMESMGILERINDGWILTEYGRQTYTSWRSRIYNPTDGWSPEIVKDIAYYIQRNNVDVTHIKRQK